MKILAIKKNMPLQQNKILNRCLLQKTTTLLNIAGSSFHDKAINMIIPGGLNPLEKLYHASTGNYPQSVMNRWFEKGTGIIHEGDYEVKIGDHLSGDPDYKLHPVSTEDVYPISDDYSSDIDDSNEGSGHTGIIGKILDIFTGD